MNRKEVIELFELHNPKSPEEATSLGIKLTYIDSGVFRNVFSIPHTQLVVKFPQSKEESTTYYCGYEDCRMNDDYDYPKSNIKHSRLEINAIIKLTKNKEVCKHIPKLFYYNKKTGVLIVKKYKSHKIHSRLKFVEKIAKLLKVTDDDYGWSNIGKDTDGTLILLDLGIR